MSFKLSLFEQPNPIWCFVFVTLSNLQGTHRFAAAGVHFTTPFRPCQELFLKFFQTFSALRSARQASPLLAALTGDLISLPYLSSLVKNFFSHRQVVFVLSFKLAFDLETTVSRTALIGYHCSLHLSTLSSTFFKKIFHRYRTPILRSPFDKLSP